VEIRKFSLSCRDKVRKEPVIDKIRRESDANESIVIENVPILW
jgi:hypothetical protein